ncbi:MAG: alpha/beta hydrolase, partial [Gemmatimonadetes bacterium]|nr:alpha/beta hydrolase [Gemmatimonadota bacterium]
MLRWARRIAIGLLSLVVIAAGAGAAYQALATRRDSSRFPAVGSLVDVGGRRLHLYCSGNGEPTVILDGPVGASHLIWTRVQPAIAEITRVCSYDRAGFGWSDAARGDRTSEAMAADLYALLRNAGVSGPYVLAANSLGGLNARLFALRHPEDVSGMILADSGHEDQFKRLPASAGVTSREVWALRVFRIAVRLGITRLAGLALGEGSSAMLPESLRPGARAMGFRTAWVDAAYREVTQAESGHAAAGLALANGPHPLLGDKPLVVLVRDSTDAQFIEQPGVREVWMALQAELAASSHRGTLATVEGSGHFIEVDRPGVFVDAVRRVVESVRDSLPAPSSASPEPP